MSNAEWQEVAATAFAVTSPALKPFVGHSILGSRRVVDPYGSVFFNDTGLAARGGARTRWHDTLNRAIFAALREGEVQVVREVEGLFRDLIPQSNRTAYLRANPYSRRRNGIVPDIRYCRNLVFNLVDVKTMGFNRSRYGRSGRTRGRRPPDMRADRVHAEYLAKARALPGTRQRLRPRVCGPLRARPQPRLRP